MNIKKKYLYGLASVIVLLVVGGILSYHFFLKETPKKAEYLTPEGLMKLPAREKVKYSEYPYEENENYTIYKTIFESAGSEIHGLLLEPKTEGKAPGVVLLPGAGVDKVSELPVARTIANLGYAVHVIDQRGVGETGGRMPSIEEDFLNFQNGIIAKWHLPIIDALVGADVLSTRDKVDSSRIILMGESMGGRVAMIAGSIDSRMKGVLAISSAGFHYGDGMEEKDRYARSLDADSYVFMLSPRPLIMIHSVWDKTIPINSAAETFEKAKKPKLFVTVNSTDCRHGYCEEMLTPLNYSLQAIAYGGK